MNIRVYAPNQKQNHLQELARKNVEKLGTFFERIKSAEVVFTEEEDKMVEMKLYLMRRVLYAAEKAAAYEDALENAMEKMRRQLMSYKKEVAIF